MLIDKTKLFVELGLINMGCRGEGDGLKQSSRARTNKVGSNKMAESVPHVKPPEPLEISTGDPAHSWGKWKQNFEIYLKANAGSKKPDEMKVGLLLNHIGDSCLESYSNFIYLPKHDNPAGGEAKLPAEYPDNYATVLAKFEAYFQKRDPQLML